MNVVSHVNIGSHIRMATAKPFMMMGVMFRRIRTRFCVRLAKWLGCACLSLMMTGAVCIVGTIRSDDGV